MKEVQAQTQITQAFSAQAPRAIADFASEQEKSIRDQLKKDPTNVDLQADLAKWDEGGSYRVALHTLSGALSGGVGGALGALAVAGAADPLNLLQAKIADVLVQQGMSPEAARMASQAVAEVGALGTGALVGGMAGGATALTVDTNNRQLHPTEKQIIRDVLAKDYAAKHPGMSVTQAEQVLSAQLLRQVDDNAGSAGGYDQDAANYLNAYKYAHQGITVGKDQWGASVPLFGVSGFSQRTDSTIFSAHPQTSNPPASFTVGTMFGAVKTAGIAFGERIYYFGDVLSDMKTGIADIFTDPYGTLAKAQANARYVLNQAGGGNFDPAAKMAGQQLADSTVGTAVGVGVGTAVKTAGGLLSSSGKAETLTVSRGGIVGDEPFSSDGLASGGMNHPVANSASQISDIVNSPIDLAHSIAADYTKAGRPAGGHSLIGGDVKIVPGSESVPDATGVYNATIQVPDPKNPGLWLTKTSNGSVNSMFPKNWDAPRIQLEVEGAWNSPNKVVIGDKWMSYTPSGVKVEGFLTPRVTVFPKYQH
jgi:filamentous hemagglutinin